MKHHTKNHHAVSLGRIGGKAGTGDSKRRNVTSEQAKRAVAVRWARYRAAKQAASRRNGRKGGRKKK
jgi:hypothetical protein